MSKKEVTLLSLGPSYVECRFETEEVWGVYRCLLEPSLKDRKFTKIFSIDGKWQTINDHPPFLQTSIDESSKRAAELGIPVVGMRDYVTEHYPTKEVVAKFHTSYFGPTVTYMIAYALLYGYEKIHIYGIDQGPELMYQTGKPAVTFWLGLATGLGVELVMGKGSLKWTYSAGLTGLPMAWVREEYEKLYVKLVPESERMEAIV